MSDSILSHGQTRNRKKNLLRLKTCIIEKLRFKRLVFFLFYFIYLFIISVVVVVVFHNIVPAYGNTWSRFIQSSEIGDKVIYFYKPGYQSVLCFFIVSSYLSVV